MKIDWTQFKNYKITRNIDMLMLEDAGFYYLYMPENNITVECVIDKNPSDPTELNDFETNYKTQCNPTREV